jgi:predicted secreted hydrolase
MNAHRKSFTTCVILTIILCTINCCNKPGRPLSFPFDHGPHFDSINEWWYFTGEVMSREGKALGFEFTIFKRWVGGSNIFAYLGHLAVSDPETLEHSFAEVATLVPVDAIKEGIPEVNINNFSYAYSEATGIVIQAEAGDLAVNLSLTPDEYPLPHGEDGIIVMGDGIDSYYYSFTNLLTEGSISINGITYSVISGRTWMDHQWGNYTLAGMLWDWFSLRLEDGSALMLFQFRNAFDEVVRTNWTYISSTGSVTYGDEFSVQATRTYRDEQGKATYPVDWVIEVGDIEADFEVRPLFDEQSLYEVKTPRYWEGLCSVSGSIRGEPVGGSAYVELTGYKDR